MAATSVALVVFVYVYVYECMRACAIQAVEVVDRQKLPSYAFSLPFSPICLPIRIEYVYFIVCHSVDVRAHDGCNAL